MEENVKSGNKVLYIILAILGVIIVILAAAIIYLMVTRFLPEKKIENHINLGQEYLEDEEYESAITEFNKVLDIDSENVEAYIGLSEAYEGLGKYEKAMKICKKGYEATDSKKLKKKIAYFEELMADTEDDIADNNAEDSDVTVDSSVAAATETAAEETSAAEESESAPDIDAAAADEIEVSCETFGGEGEYESQLYSIYTGKDKNGNTLWQHRTDYFAHSLPASSWEMGKYKTFFYYYMQGQIVALDLLSGDVLWTAYLDDPEEITAAYFFEGNYIYVVSGYGNYYKLDISGEILVNGHDIFDYVYYEAESFSSYDKNTLELIARADRPNQELVYYIDKNNLNTVKVERIDPDTQEWEVIYENQ
jgi:tetratricopeptide (TPR) repeat protein